MRCLLGCNRKALRLFSLSANRLTVTVKGTRRQAERAFVLHLIDYKIGSRSFYANDRDPALPAELASNVAAVSGLSNLALVRSPLVANSPALATACTPSISFLFGNYLYYIGSAPQYLTYQTMVDDLGTVLYGFSPLSPVTNLGHCVWFYLTYGIHTDNQFEDDAPLSPSNRSSSTPARSSKRAKTLATATAARQLKEKQAATSVNSQKIGLLEFDTFHPSDIQDWLSLMNANPSYASRLSAVPVNGGVSSPGAGEDEVLLDIVTVMLADPSPNTKYVVYDAPNGTTYQQMFNAMINDGVSVISNSWSQCEDQTSLADAQSIDSVLAQAAASGISVFNGSGDNGGTCLDGSANTIGVPTDSPHATSVGGTSPTFGPGLTYGSEAYWDGSAHVPPTGSGGYGVSKYFPRPSYQNGLTSSTMRSVPDLAVAADPWAGMSICQADAGGCPTGLLYGGTSMAAPLMAGMTALLNETVGTNLGQANPVLYPLAGTSAFHANGASFNLVGLGSPNYYPLLAALSHHQPGPADPSNSTAGGTLFPVADGVTQAIVRVNLADANSLPVAGKSVSLTPNSGSQAVIVASSGPSDDTKGAVTFAVTDTALETVTFVVTDTTDGVTLTTQPMLAFVGPPATGGSINASPSSVASNGSSQATITVTLQNAAGAGAAGKLVTLSQGSAHSVITAPNPPVTGADGQIQFTATDNVSETVTYTAVDVYDANLAVPGSASVNFARTQYVLRWHSADCGQRFHADSIRHRLPRPELLL